MTDLFEKSMETLELPRVLSLLADQAVTEEGKERARRLRPETDPAEVALRLKETTAAVNKMVLRGSPSFSGVKPVAGSLQREMCIRDRIDTEAGRMAVSFDGINLKESILHPPGPA